MSVEARVVEHANGVFEPWCDQHGIEADPKTGFAPQQILTPDRVWAQRRVDSHNRKFHSEGEERMTNHKAEAEALLGEAHDHVIEGVGPTEAIRAGLKTLEAQVHATLALAASNEALVEQARIANLIALNQQASQNLNRATSAELGDEASGLLADEGIREALGLNKKEEK